MRKTIAVVLAVLMLISVIPISVGAITEDEHLSDVPEGYIGVYTKDDLYEVRSNPSGKYILMNDIVFDEADFVKGGGFYNSGKGWEPIGTSSTPFTGVFNGNYFTIKNLYMNTTSDYAGLFGYCSNSTIEKLRLEKATIFGGNNTGGIVAFMEHGSVLSCSFNGTIIGDKYVGGVIGQAYTTKGAVISYCESYGSITGTSFVGGILGCHNTFSKAVDTGRYRINYCVNAALVYGSDSVGGIAGRIVLSRGYNNSGTYYIGVTSTINQCINTGDIICSGDYIGGIIGEVHTETYVASEQKIDNCYNTGKIFANGYAGGIIGYYTYDNVFQVKVIVNSSYSVGNVFANNDFGGCFGKIPTSVSYCYYLDEAVSDASCLSGIAKSTDQLVRQGTFEQWSFDSIWTMEGREDYEYPELHDVELVFPGEYPYHKHDYVASVTTPATHLTEGVMTYTCTCGDTYTEEIAKTTEHKYNAVVTAPTCTEQGFTTYTCECGDSYVADFVKENGHSYTAEITTPATHLTEGVMTYTCACGDTYTEEIAKTTEHKYNAVVTAPTCTEQGFTTYTCECGDSYVADFVKENGHSYTAEVTTLATHLTEGVMTYTCTCGDAYVEAIARLAEHTYSSYVEIEPSCKTNGTKIFECECGASYEEEIASLGHTDTDDNGRCDRCNVAVCDHMCHKTGFMGFIWKIVLFFSKLFGLNPVCDCGAVHY